MHDHEIRLYSTSGCHLCDQVFEQLLASPAAVGCKLTVIDIAHDDALMADFAERIPVLQCGDCTLEAPIGVGEVDSWLARVRR